MRILAPARAVSTAAALLLLSCQSTFNPEDADLASSLSMLSSSVVSQGCTFTISAVARPGTLPPLYDYVVARQASGTCAYAAASATLGSTYAAGSGITGNDNGVAVAYVNKGTPSGSSPRTVSLKQIDVATLGTVRSTSFACPPAGMIVPSTGLADLFMLNGTTLQVNGSKGCAFTGENGSGGSFYAFYFDFFTTAGAPVIIAY